jgi:hypothetical protein
MYAVSRIATLSLLIAAGTATAAITASAVLAADAQTLMPLQAQVSHLPGHTVVSHYTVLADVHYEVVTTIVPGTGTSGVATRHRMQLAVGQEFAFELDQDNTTAAATAISVTTMPEAVRMAYQ